MHQYKFSKKDKGVSWFSMLLAVFRSLFRFMPLYILAICPENRDESNGNSNIKLWLQFIPIFGALHSQLLKGHTTKKDISMLNKRFLSPITMKRSGGVIC
jgi:hypothetical protein